MINESKLSYYTGEIKFDPSKNKNLKLKFVGAFQKNLRETIDKNLDDAGVKEEYWNTSYQSLSNLLNKARS